MAYLPGTFRERLQDLLKDNKITQAELAAKIGISESKLSRFISEKGDNLNQDSITKMARIFNVSTDFLLGETDVPDRKNYDISELGLSAEAARNLYTGKVNSRVVSRLLENESFARLTDAIVLYLDDVNVNGVVAKNQMNRSLANVFERLARNQPDLKRAATQMAQIKMQSIEPIHQAELKNIQKQFLTAIHEVKNDADNMRESTQTKTKVITEKLFEKLVKGQDLMHLSITPEQFAEALTDVVAEETGDISPETFIQMNQAFLAVFQDLENAKRNGRR